MNSLSKIQEFYERLGALSHQAGTDSIVHKNSLWCTTIDGGPTVLTMSFWIQLHAGLINFQYLHDLKPTSLPELEGLPGKLSSWKPSVYATYDYNSVSEDEIKLSLKVILEDYLKVEDFSGLKMIVEKL